MPAQALQLPALSGNMGLAKGRARGSRFACAMRSMQLTGSNAHVGFDLRTFEWLGKAKASYNIVSERRHQLNVHLVEVNISDKDHPDGGTFIGRLACFSASTAWLPALMSRGT